MKLLSTLVLLLLCGCVKYDHVADQLEPKVEYNIVVIDGCEYLSYHLGGKTYGLTHKGNCTNIVHGHER